MKILYGINTNGQGHINRARVFITQLLEDGHDVHVLLAGRQPPHYAFELSPKTFFKPGPIDFYKDHRVDLNKTLQVNLVNIPEYAAVRKELIELDAKENFDAIFTDFEPHSSVVGKKTGKPVVCIDRQHAVFHPAITVAPGKPHEKMGMRWVQNIMMPFYNHCFALDFTQTIETAGDITLFPLVWKQELKDLETSLGEHIICYLSWYDSKKVVEILSQFPRETFFVYGFNKNKKVKNIHFKKTTRTGFLQDLASSKAVIGNAGFNLAWETFLLKKLIWTIPYHNQFEQVSNAYRLEQMGLGYRSKQLTAKDLQAFLQWLETKKYNFTTDLVVLQPSDLLARVYDFLEEYRLDTFPKSRYIRKGIRLELNRWRMRQEILNEIRLKTV